MKRRMFWFYYDVYFFIPHFKVVNIACVHFKGTEIKYYFSERSYVSEFSITIQRSSTTYLGQFDKNDKTYHGSEFHEINFS